MTRLHFLLLVALPLCAAQFSIQGPSDGNRRSQGLKYDSQKGIQYDDQSASLGSGDFSIQGASDGNSNFNIQGASDGNSDFQIHGATDGSANFHVRGPTDGNANFQIQGATDGNANFQIQGATDGNANFQIQGATNGQAQEDYNDNRGQGRALQYQDPSGLKVNWKSYQHAARAQQQPEPQSELNYAPAARKKAPRRQQIQQAPQELPEPAQKNYKVFAKAPPSIQQLLQFQQQIPYVNSIPQHLRYDFTNAPVAQSPQPAVQEDQIEEQRPLRNRAKPRGPARQKRGAQQQKQQQQRQRIAPPPAEPQPKLSTNIPSRIQEILQYQSKIPYENHIPEQWRYEALLKQEGATIQQQYQLQPAPEPIRHSQKVRQRRQAQKQQQTQQYHEPQPHYNPNVPSHLQQILKYQSQAPYTSVIPEQFRYEKLVAAAQGHRQKRQAPRYQAGQDQSQVDLSKYQRISQAQAAPAEAVPQYSTNLPSSIKQLLQYQSQTPYDIIANKINFRLDKPYVPQPIVPAPISQIPQTQRPLYKPAAAAAQPIAPAPQYQQPQSAYQQPQYQQPRPQYQQPQQPAAYQPQAQRPIYQPAQPQYQQPAQPQYQQPAQPLYQQPAQPLYQQPAAPYRPQAQPQYRPPQLPQPQYQQPQQLQRPIYQPSNSPQQPQYQQNQQLPQSQIIRPQAHPNALPQYRSPYGQATTPVRPVTENQY